MTLGGVSGSTDSRSQSIGALCGSCALLALNGTTNGSGSLTTVSVPGTTTIVLNSPLTAANALDVFHTGAANLTSAAVKAQLTDSLSTQSTRQTMRDATLKLEGRLFDLPGGSVKVATGAEMLFYTVKEDVTRPLGTGPASTGSSTLSLPFDRSVKSAFVEVLAPLVNPSQNIPFVRSADLNLSGRYDKYSDFGSTSNPKIGANWEVVEGFKLRANYAKSFVAPALTSRGDAVTGTTAETSVAAGPSITNVSTATYPNLIGLPGCAVGATTCNLGGGVTGLQINGGNAALKPQKGTSYAFGADWHPAFASGLRLSATLWNNKIIGAITAPSAAFAVNAAGLNSLLTVYGPAGATPAQIAAITAGRPLTTSIPATVYYVYNFQQRNALNLNVQGVDLEASYHFDTSIGDFTATAIASYKTKFDQQVGVGATTFSVLNTTGFNTTFPSIKLDSRAGLDWRGKTGFSADLFWNHTGAYFNWSGSAAVPLVKNSAGVPTSGGDRVPAGNTFDIHGAYDFPGDGVVKGLQVYVDIQNMFDKAPPFYNSANGYDSFSGNPIGRVTSVGLRKKF